jgi:hypothetical protein
MYFAMSENIISSAEAEGLLRKIETETHTNPGLLCCGGELAGDHKWLRENLNEAGLLISGDDDKEHPLFLELPLDALLRFR